MAAVRFMRQLNSQEIKAAVTQLGGMSIPNVKNIILVASGKGGVGKSTTTVNFACALQQAGARVGIVDGDIYGPNIPKMLGSVDYEVTTQDKKFDPVLAHGLQTMSVAHLVEANTAMAWRGPMMSKVLLQLVHDTRWDSLDYLFIDLPPGTGDIQLTIGKSIPVAGSIIVTTPQDVALLDVRRGVDMFKKINIKVLGVVENMSQHICSQCGHQEDIFGHGGGQKIANECGVPLLGKLPLDIGIRQAGDSGLPIMLAESQGAIAMAYRNTALTLVAQLSQQKTNYDTRMPGVVVE